MSRAVTMFDEHGQTGEWIETAIGITTAPRGRPLNRGPDRTCFAKRSGASNARRIFWHGQIIQEALTDTLGRLNGVWASASSAGRMRPWSAMIASLR
jgi:hypothetical protein